MLCTVLYITTMACNRALQKGKILKLFLHSSSQLEEYTSVLNPPQWIIIGGKKYTCLIDIGFDVYPGSCPLRLLI